MNCEWLIDFETGIAYFLAAEFIPWRDPAWMKLWDTVERRIYSGLR